MKRALAGLLLAALPPFASAQAMEPGEWQFNSTVSSPMLPGPQTSTFTQCVTPAEAADPTRFTARDQSAGCVVTPGARTPASYSWAVSCPQQGMSGSGTARFAPGAIESEMQVHAEMQGQKLVMSTRVSGRRLGPCKPG